MKSSKRTILTALGVVFLALAATAIYSACIPDGEPDAKSRAKQVSTRTELIGGPVALGEIGDFIMENDQIRVVVENKGSASGSGLFGGSLIDLDLVHQNAEGDLFGGNGKDTFGEFFPAYFLEMLDPEEVVVLNDGSDGKAAIIEVRGRGGEFVTMLRFINQAMVNSYNPKFNDILAGEPANSDGKPMVRFRVRYILEPGARHVRIESSLDNVSGQELGFPNRDVVAQLNSDALKDILPIDLSEFSVPLGSVLGFGKLNSLFVPDIGYDLRWGLEDSYEKEIELPAFPGKVTNFVASSNTEGTNYGFIKGASEDRNFVHNKDHIYGDTDTDDMLLLFYASGFGGVLTHDMPSTLADGESFTFTNYIIVGDGDVASILDEGFKIRGVDTQQVAGRVVDELTGEPVGKNATVLIYRAREDEGVSNAGCAVSGEGADAVKPMAYSQAHTSKEGHFAFTLPAGDYCFRTRADGRPLSDYTAFEVADEGVVLQPKAKAYAAIEARVVDASGNPIPAKLMLVGTHEFRGELDKRHFLFDLEAGESWRVSDMVPDTADDPQTRKYLEAIAYASSDGNVRLKARPGTYDVFFSRGTEYELVKRDAVELVPGKTRRMQIKLERQIDPEGYLSGDFHMHARGSIDSGLDFDHRVISVAAEGVEVVASTDHNHVSDYAPYILRNELHPWLKSVIGVELTTFEFGHFNAFPLDYEVGSVTGGAVPWQHLPPQKIFDELRSHGSLSEDNTIIQINHPRDSILGYFGQYSVDPFSTEVSLPFQNAGGFVETATTTLSTSTGSSYMRDCSQEGVDCRRGNRGYESTFSWDFDAIEIFNGKHLDQLRHYRIPYGPGDWPDAVSEALIEAVCTDEYEDELNQYCAGDDPENPRIPEEDCAHPLQGHALSDWCPFGEDQLHERYAKGDVMCDGDEVAYPGALDDWYNFLNYPRDFVRGDGSPSEAPVYKKFTATGNSDSHAAGTPEFRQPGSPRNYFFVGHDSPAKMTEAELAGALNDHRNIVTNGPFATMAIAEASIGDEVKVSEASVDIEVFISAADWVGADRFQIIANGEMVELQDDPTPTVYEFELDENGEFETTVTVEMDKDTWFVLEVEGSNNLFPVYTPQEIPQVAFDAAIGSIAGAFGFGGAVEGLSPTETFPLTPFAFTNPIWVIYDQGSDTDGEFTPPQPAVRSCSDSQFQANALLGPEDLDKVPSRLDAVSMPFEVKAHPHNTPFERTKGEFRDVRVLFENWHTH
jgi:hypothetical protein